MLRCIVSFSSSMMICEDTWADDTKILGKPATAIMIRRITLKMPRIVNDVVCGWSLGEVMCKASSWFELLDDK